MKTMEIQPPLTHEEIHSSIEEPSNTIGPKRCRGYLCIVKSFLGQLPNCHWHSIRAEDDDLLEGLFYNLNFGVLRHEVVGRVWLA